MEPDQGRPTNRRATPEKEKIRAQEKGERCRGYGEEEGVRALNCLMKRGKVTYGREGTPQKKGGAAQDAGPNERTIGAYGDSGKNGKKPAPSALNEVRMWKSMRGRA